MELFDFIKVLFGNKAEYERLKDYEKNKFFFMTNRFMFISYPVQAQMFNHIKVSQARVLDYWHRNMSHVYGRVPDWIYTKTKKAAEKKTTVKVPSDEAIEMYLTRNGYSRRQLDESVKILGAESTYAPIFKIDKMLKSNAE